MIKDPEETLERQGCLARMGRQGTPDNQGLRVTPV